MLLYLCQTMVHPPLFYKQYIFEGFNVVKNNLRQLREKHNYTQDELAGQVGVSRQTIISLEKGKYDPSIKLAFKLSKTLSTPIEDIFLFEMDDHENNE